MKKIFLLMTAFCCLLSVSCYAAEDENEETVIASGWSGMNQYPTVEIDGYRISFQSMKGCPWSFTDKGTLTIGDGYFGSMPDWTDIYDLSNWFIMTENGEYVSSFSFDESEFRQLADRAAQEMGIVNYQRYHYDIEWWNIMQDVKKVVISEGIYNIAAYAFVMFSNLTEINILSTTGQIENVGEFSIPGLKAINVAEGNPYYSSENGILYNKTKTDLMEYPRGKEGDFVIPNSVTSIGYAAFSSCSGLTSITIPNSVTSVGVDAFLGCSGLTSINVDQNNAIYSSENDILYNKTKTKLIMCPQKKEGSVTIPNSVTNIGKSAFSNCIGLTSVDISNSVTSIESSAFSGCSGLTFIDIPNSVISIGDYAFSDCIGLTFVDIPNSVTSIGNSSFGGCSGLTSINVDQNNAIYSSENDILCNKTKTELIMCPQKKEGNVTIPNSVTSIGESAFRDCIGLTSVAIPNSVISIGSCAFLGCIGLTSVVIPNSVTSIGSNAFDGCSGLTSVAIPNSVTSIDNYAFSRCSSLDTIKVYWEEPLSVSFYVFGNVASSCVLVVPKGAKAAYEKVAFWKDFIIVERESVLEENITIEPQLQAVTITWPQVPDALEYTLVIYEDEALTQIVSTIHFDADDAVAGGLRAGGAREFSHTVTGLSSGTEYYYELTANGADDEIIDKTQGNFTTRSTTDVSESLANNWIVYARNQSIVVENAQGQPIRIVDANGITWASKTNALSAEQFYMLSKGVYIVIIGDKSQKVLVQ